MVNNFRLFPPYEGGKGDVDPAGSYQHSVRIAMQNKHPPAPLHKGDFVNAFRSFTTFRMTIRFPLRRGQGGC